MNKYKLVFDRAARVAFALLSGRVFVVASEVKIQFGSVEEAEQFKQSLENCCSAIRQLSEADENEYQGVPSSAGDFAHGTGGGKRNIRGTNSLT